MIDDAANSLPRNCVYRFEITVSEKVVDQNRHVNNVVYVQWMQDAAIQHAAASGCTRLTQALGAIWVARTHRIEYLSPAFAGDVITVVTWIANFRKVRSLRTAQAAQCMPPMAKVVVVAMSAPIRARSGQR